jgi:hypothetical protein
MNYMNAAWLVKRYEEAKTIRAPLEAGYKRSALYCLPADYPLWSSSSGHLATPAGSQSARSLVFDTTAKRAIPKFTTICHRLATPQSQIWHKLRASNADLMRQRRVQIYFQELNDLLWARRYDPKARFNPTQTEVYASWGGYGNGVKYIAERPVTPLNRSRGLAYRSIHFKDIFVLVDEWNNIYATFRRFWLNARQAADKFKNRELLPPAIRAELDKPQPSETRLFEFFQVVLPRDDYDAARLDAKRFPLASVYVCLEGQCIVAEPGGYNTNPFIMSRHFPQPSNPYGLGPMDFVIDAAGSASAMKKTLLKQGQKAVDPVLLAHDDGVVNGNVDLRPGSVNYGGVTAKGEPLIRPLETGNFSWGENLLTDERNDIEDAFFIKLFQILVDTPEMTATEVMERVAEKSALLAPTMGMMQSEDLGPTIDRELDVLAQLGQMPEMPPELIEAKGEYEVVYTSPLAKQQRTEEVAGFMRIVEMATNAAAATGNSKPLRRINFDRAIPDIADISSVRAEWLNDDDEVEALSQQDHEAAQVEQLSNAAPAIAGLMKAQQGGARKAAP